MNMIERYINTDFPLEKVYIGMIVCIRDQSMKLSIQNEELGVIEEIEKCQFENKCINKNKCGGTLIKLIHAQGPIDETYTISCSCTMYTLDNKKIVRSRTE